MEKRCNVSEKKKSLILLFSLPLALLSVLQLMLMHSDTQ